MKRFVLIFLLLAFVLALTAPTFAAGERWSLQTSQAAITEQILLDQNGDTMDYPVWVYGIEIFADETGSFAGFYDVDTLAELGASTTYPKDEIGEATAYNTKTKMYDNPRYYADGIGVYMTKGVAWALYGPEPF